MLLLLSPIIVAYVNLLVKLFNSVAVDHCMCDYQYADCTITAADHQQYISYISDPEDASGRQTFGWVEKDGDPGDKTGPTTPEETVYVNQIIDLNVDINLNPCFRWSDFIVFFRSKVQYFASLFYIDHQSSFNLLFIFVTKKIKIMVLLNI